MSAYELHDLLLANRGLIYDTWNFFVSIHLALLGLLFLTRGGGAPLRRLLIIPGYGAFMFVNYRAQVDNYTYAGELIAKISTMESAADLLPETGRTWIVQYLPHVYIAASALAVLLIVSTLGWPRRKPAT